MFRGPLTTGDSPGPVACALSLADDGALSYALRSLFSTDLRECGVSRCKTTTKPGRMPLPPPVTIRQPRSSSKANFCSALSLFEGSNSTIFTSTVDSFQRYSPATQQRQWTTLT